MHAVEGVRGEACAPQWKRWSGDRQPRELGACRPLIEPGRSLTSLARAPRGSACRRCGGAVCTGEGLSAPEVVVAEPSTRKSVYTREALSAPEVIAAVASTRNYPSHFLVVAVASTRKYPSKAFLILLLLLVVVVLLLLLLLMMMMMMMMLVLFGAW